MISVDLNDQMARDCPDCVPHDDEVAVSGVVSRSGCEPQYRSMEQCFAAQDSTQRYAACQPLMKLFQQCLSDAHNKTK